ncbi:unnamed protein product [Heligmosomoides polygyrus]|uniref:Uncharacterized protein n=1 Tax=Heligmosomoides polygyrus TaxID=6339 RepID=A0A183F432_HELPZ|nr:unnamed protein product [Heligmosomoides polygyrus]
MESRSPLWAPYTASRLGLGWKRYLVRSICTAARRFAIGRAPVASGKTLEMAVTAGPPLWEEPSLRARKTPEFESERTSAAVSAESMMRTQQKSSAAELFVHRLEGDGERKRRRRQATSSARFGRAPPQTARLRSDRWLVYLDNRRHSSRFELILSDVSATTVRVQSGWPERLGGVRCGRHSRSHPTNLP